MSKTTWNLLFYTFTDNELEIGSFKDLAKLTSIKHDYDAITINILLDTNTMGSYLIKIQGNPYDRDAIRMTRLRNLNMTKTETLTHFIKQSVIEDPACHVALIMGGHGSGWYLITEQNSSMSMRELTLAVKNSGIHLNLLCFDDCLMANLEALNDIRTVTDYVIAYEDYAGWNGIIEPKTLCIFQNNQDVYSVAVALAENLIMNITDADDATDVSVLSTSHVTELVEFLKKSHLKKPTNYNTAIDPNYWQLHDLYEIVKFSLTTIDFDKFLEIYKKVVRFYCQSNNKNNPMHHGLSCIVDPETDTDDVGKTWRQLEYIISFDK